MEFCVMCRLRFLDPMGLLLWFWLCLRLDKVAKRQKMDGSGVDIGMNTILFDARWESCERLGTDVRMFFYVLVVGVVGVVDVAKNDALYENVDNQFGVLSLL